MRTLLKALATPLLVMFYISVSCATALFPAPTRIRRSVRIRITSFFAGLALALYGIRVHVRHRERLHARHAHLIVANHLSYTDILVIASLRPAVFVTSVELKQTPLLGMLAEMGGSLYVERRKRSGLKQEIAEIAAVLGRGHSVVLFAEGTTSNGDRVLPFKYSLFDAAMASRIDILPLCLRYTAVNGEPLTHHNRDRIFYYGGAAFSRHFPRFLTLASIDVEVLPLTTISVHAHADRKELAAQAYSAISSAYHG